jgi:hypothetical protein
MFSHKEDPKIHPDAPRKACGMRTATGQVCRVLTCRSPNQVTILTNHHVFICDIIVQTLSPFVASIIGNVQSFPELPTGYTIESAYSNPNLTHKLNPGDISS